MKTALATSFAVTPGTGLGRYVSGRRASHDDRRFGAARWQSGGDAGPNSMWVESARHKE